MKFIFLLFFCVWNHVVLAQKLTEKQHKSIRNTIESQFSTVADHFKYDMGYLNLCVVNQDTFYNPNGYNYVFKLRNGSAARLDQSPFHGSNSFRYIFLGKINCMLWEGTVFLLQTTIYLFLFLS